MKIRVALGLCVVLGAGFISVRAADTPAQAAARAALIQKLNQPDDSPTQLLPATNTLSKAVVEQPAKSATTVTETVPEKAVTPQTAPVAAPPVVAPAAVIPAAVAPAVIAPTAVSPEAVAPTRSFLIMALLILSPLLASLVIMSVLLFKLRALKLLLLKHPAIVAPAVVAPSKVQPAAAAATPKPTPALAATKRPVQRRKRVRQQNGAESDVNLPKTGWEIGQAERSKSIKS